MAAVLLTPEEVAERLRLALNTVYIWLREGRLPGIKIGRRWRVRADDLDAFIDARAGNVRHDQEPDDEEYDESVPPVWEWMSQAFRDIPREELDRIPKDAIENLDHYVFGSPKREPGA